MLRILADHPEIFDEIDQGSSILVWSKKTKQWKPLIKLEVAPVVEEVTLDLDDAIEIED